MTSSDQPLTSDGIPIPPIFYSAYSKANWATKQIYDFDAAVRDYLDNGMRITVEQPDGPDGEMLIDVSTDPFEVPVALYVGDVVRNLRDALDHSISAIFRDKLGTGADRRTKFPIAENRDNLVGVVDSTFVNTCFDDISDAILYEINPTKAGNFPIWGLGQINNADKHRFLINAAHFSFVPYAEFEDASGNLCAENLYWVEPGAKFTYRVPAHVRVTSDAHLSKTAFIAFGPAEAFSRAQVGPTLISCSQAVIAALDALVKAYIKSLPAPERP